jgi:hypothetical protein
MPAIFAFACSRCGTLREGSPSFGFFAPDQYASLSDEQKERLGTLTEDVCIIADGDGTDRFVRNDIALYPSTRARPADVVVRAAGMRPRVVLHRGDPEDDSLVVDQVNGISMARAQELAERALHGRRTP